jgi:hypothetical protein
MVESESIRDYEVFDFKIQFVDKNKTDIQILTSVCNAFGVQSWTTMDEHAAIETARFIKPDVITLDLAWFDIQMIIKLKKSSSKSTLFVFNYLPAQKPILREYGASAQMEEKYELISLIKRLR